MKNFITFRRYHIDKILSATQFRGKVLDVGGKKANPRGCFRPPLNRVESWCYLNLDGSTCPDYLCSAEDIPVEDCFFDSILMAEVLEHLENPEKVLREINRVTKENGTLTITMPFLGAIHADPEDFQRWTPDKFKVEFKKAGFKVEEITPMGGIWGVVFDMLYSMTSSPSLFSRIVRRLIKLFAPFILFADSKIGLKNVITTGFYVRASKVS